MKRPKCGPYGRSDIERFFSQVVRSPGGCWLWTGALSKWGYGYFRLEKMVRSNRAAWLLFRGLIPDGSHVLHHCDTACCVNPEHLYLGTHHDNMRDMVIRGRSASLPGEKNGRAKLTHGEVVEIRESPLPSRTLAKLYGIGKTQVLRIKHGEQW